MTLENSSLTEFADSLENWFSNSSPSDLQLLEYAQKLDENAKAFLFGSTNILIRRIQVEKEKLFETFFPDQQTLSSFQKITFLETLAGTQDLQEVNNWLKENNFKELLTEDYLEEKSIAFKFILDLRRLIKLDAYQDLEEYYGYLRWINSSVKPEYFQSYILNILSRAACEYRRTSRHYAIPDQIN